MSAFRVALAAFAVTALSTACAAGQHAATALEKSSIDGTGGNVGTMQLAGVVIQAPSGSSFQPGSNAALTVYVVNNGTTPDSLSSITSAGFGAWKIVPTSKVAGLLTARTRSSAGASTGSSAPLAVGAGAAVGLGLQNLTPGHGSPTTIVLEKLTKQIFPGTPVRITFTFADAGSLTLTVPVSLSSQPQNQTLPG